MENKKNTKNISLDININILKYCLSFVMILCFIISAVIACTMIFEENLYGYFKMEIIWELQTYLILADIFTLAVMSVLAHFYREKLDELILELSLKCVHENK